MLRTKCGHSGVGVERVKVARKTERWSPKTSQVTLPKLKLIDDPSPLALPLSSLSRPTRDNDAAETETNCGGPLDTRGNPNPKGPTSTDQWK